MPWKRRGDREYFYLSRRVDGRVVTEYVGTGELAELVAAGVEHARHLRAASRVVDRERSRSDREWEAEADRLVSRALGLAAWIMGAAGYHRHDRGPWRKRRGTMSKGVDTSGSLGGAGGALASASTGSPALAGSSGRPTEALGWGPDRAALRSLAERYCGADAAGRRSRESLMADAEKMARDLAGPAPTALVMVLAETVAFAWLELRMAQASDHNYSKRTIAQSDSAGRKVDRAHRRFLRAAKALSDVQRVPASVLVQINQQYHVTGEETGPSVEADEQPRSPARR